jgi:hypothetical protein
MLNLFRRFQEQVRYLVDQAFARQFVGQLLLFVTLVFTVTLIGMTAVFFGLFSEENAAVKYIPRSIDSSFWDSLWWSINQVVRLPGFANAYGATFPVLLYSLFLSFSGLVVFSVLISLINNTMRSRIDALRKGDTPVIERNHILILGWNNKVFSVLKQLAQLKSSSKVVILAPEKIDEMQDQLRVAGIRRRHIKIILRSGIPSNHGELERVAFERASSVIILATDADDSEAIKTIMLLTANRVWPGPPPVLTSEIALEQNYELATIAAKNKLHVISSNYVISKVIVQTIRNPGLSEIYREIFSPSGNNIHVQCVSQCIDRPLAEIAYGFTDAIPIGISWDDINGTVIRHRAGLNPEPDYEIIEGEKLVLLACSPAITYSMPENIPESKIVEQGGSTPRVPAKVLLIGWTDILYDILKELNAHALHGTEVTILSDTSEEDAKQQTAIHQANELKNLILIFHRGDAVMQTTYLAIDLSTFNSIVVLADQTNEFEDADTRTLRILLRLKYLRKNNKIWAQTIAELLDDNNRVLLNDLGVDDIIVSSEAVSAQLAHIARQEILAPIYHELLSAGGIEISLRPASDYVKLNVDCYFNDLIYSSQKKMEIALGIRLAQKNGEIILNPPRDSHWQLGVNDKIIVLAQQIYQ